MGVPAAVAAVGLLVSAAGAAQPAEASKPAKPFAPAGREVRWDPAITRGVLGNGFRYVIVHNASPKGAMAVRLVVDTGSFDEEESERGVAHLIEHLAFRSTRHFANDEVEKTLSANGIAFGRDFNAGTGLYGTFYQLDIARPNPVSLDTAFRWLRDIGDGLLFSAADVDSERKIVIAERQQALTTIARFREGVMRFEAGDLRSVRRSPAGELSVLQSVTPAEVRAFHDRWYRPAATTVIVVGDAPVEEIRARVEKAFGDWAPSPVRAARPALGAPKTDRKLDILTRSEPGLPDMAVACHLLPPEGKAAMTPERLRARAATSMWVRILNTRFAALAASHAAPVISLQMYNQSETREYQTNCLVVVPTGDAWRVALQAAQAELLRFERDGPSLSEIDKALEDERSGLRGEVVEAASRSTSARADALVDNVEDDQPQPDPREAMRDYDVAVEGLGAAEVAAAFRREWRDAPGPLLVVNSAKALDAQAVRAAWTGAKADAGAYAELQEVKWPYPALTAGKVVKTERLDPDFTRFTYANGLILNFKRTTLEKGKIAIRLSFGYGRSELPKGQYFTATIAGGTLFMGGLGKLSGPELKRLFPISAESLKFNIHDRRFTMASSGVADTLDNQLSLLTGFVTDPGFRPDLEPVINTAVEYGYRSFADHPDTALTLRTTKVLWPGSDVDIPSEAEVHKLKVADMAAVLKGPLTQSPLELTVVGDVDEAKVVDAVGESLGALPARKPLVKSRGDEAFFRYPATPYPSIATTYKGQEGTSVTHIVWPLYVATPARRREEYALMLLAGVVSDRVRHRVREELGMTYSPGASTEMPDFGDQGSLDVRVETAPADMDRVVREVQDIAGQLAKGNLTPEMVEAVRQPILAHAADRMNSDRDWAEVLDASSRDPGQVQDVLNFDKGVAAVTVDEVKAAAAHWLSGPPLVSIATPAAAAGGQP